MPPSNSASQIQLPDRRDRRPDWGEFYKNGAPKEVIVIDDEDDTPQRELEGRVQRHISPKLRGFGGAQPQTKRRRVGEYDAARDAEHHRTYSHRENTSKTTSSDRTTSHQTTAPTSLGSHTSTGSAGAYIVDDTNVGQKRKRVTRQQIATDKRRQDVNAVETYVPPTKPLIKAKEVHVPSLRDMQVLILHTLALLIKVDQITKLLGQGTFGKVVEALDRRINKKVAVKIIRSVQKYRDASRIELRSYMILT
ncbi:uncharacterized protein KY384_006698 [Bacidia gigantensis]|uniref:uncharacterized protein n=1 Tax=Bacidia gigantensis TaxID=2732470 RepID=UPI001D05A965|nr:uncharacterized protein KY384_006698 [Bacidia gigantensis]KAG8529009.1 hypothetical protein KY384_006698 [Bacidia gigantensis]